MSHSRFAEEDTASGKAHDFLGSCVLPSTPQWAYGESPRALKAGRPSARASRLAESLRRRQGSDTAGPRLRTEEGGDLRRVNSACKGLYYGWGLLEPVTESHPPPNCDAGRRVTWRKGPGYTAGLSGPRICRINHDEMKSAHSLSLLLIKPLRGRLLILPPTGLVGQTRPWGLVTGSSCHSC